MDNEFLLQDRLQKIRQIINKYGEENFYISFSGGADSTVLSALVDMALPDNKIPDYSDYQIWKQENPDCSPYKAKNNIKEKRFSEDH